VDQFALSVGGYGHLMADAKKDAACAKLDENARTTWADLIGKKLTPPG